MEKTITIAIERGWKGRKYLNLSGDWMGEVPKLRVISPFPNHPQLKYTTGGVNVKDHVYPPEVMLFDKSFAEAIWPDKHVCRRGETKCGDAGCENEYNWQYHLQQMVIADDPILYLEPFVTGVDQQKPSN